MAPIGAYQYGPSWAQRVRMLELKCCQLSKSAPIGRCRPRSAARTMLFGQITADRGIRPDKKTQTAFHELPHKRTHKA